MKIKILILFYLLILFSLAATAQIKDGSYQGFKINKGKTSTDIIQIQVLSLGNGVTQFSDEKNKALNGTYHIIINSQRYTIGNIAKGIAHGDWEEFYHNELYEKATFKDGKYDGKVYTYKRFGRHYTEYTMKDGIMLHAVSYHPNGKLQEERFFDENEKLHGDIIIYDADGNIIEEDRYQHGLLHGKQIEKDSRGYIKTEEYDKGVQVGEYCRLYPNGNIQEKGTYDTNGKKTGKWIFGQENGNPTSEIHYLNNKMHGEKRDYYKSGLISSIEEYVDGKLNGKRIDYDEDPHVISNEANYREGQRHGEFKVYHNGILWKESFYNEGKVVREKEYEDGKLKILRLLDEKGSLVNVNQYDKSGKKTYKNKSYKKHPSITLKEDASGIVDIDVE